MISMSLVIGLGIFRTASSTAKAAGNESIFFMAWIIGGMIALFGGLSFAEIGSRKPVTGGYYKIFAECYHPSIAFALNAVIILANASSMAGIALIGAEYLSVGMQSWIPIPPLYFSWIALAALIIFFLINRMGLHVSSKTLNVLMILKIGLLLLMICGLFFASSDVVQVVSDEQRMVTFYHGSFWIALGAALVPVCFTYGGYQHTINFGGEILNTRMMATSIVLGVGFVILLYLGANLSYVQVLGFENLKTTNGIASQLGERMLGSTGRVVISLLLFLGALAYVNIMMMTTPRIMKTMTEDGVIPFFRISGVSEIYHTNLYLYVFALLSVVVLYFTGTFDKILGFVMFLDSLGMALGAATLFYFRKNTPEYHGFKLWFYPWPTVFFIAAYLAVACSVAYKDPKPAFIGAVVFLSLIVFYFLEQHFRKKS